MSTDADLRAALLRVVVGRTAAEVPDAASWTRWTRIAGPQRVTPLLFHLVDAVPTDLDESQRDEARRRQGEVLSRCVRLEHHLLRAVEALGEVGIPVTVLKGAATAHLDHPDPSWREFHDIDLLVDPADRAGAVARLGREGWVPGYSLPGGHEEFAHAVTLVREQVEMDLHQRIAHRALGRRVPTRELLARATTFEIAGVQLRALDEVDRLVHAALHAVASRGRYRHLSSVADVLLLAERRSARAVEILERAERWRVRPLVEHAVLEAYGSARLAVAEEWLVAMRRPCTLRDRLVERAYLGGSRRPVTEELAYVRLLPGWGARGRYARGYFTVDAEYAAQHGRSGPWAQTRYVLAKLRARTP